ncbi:MAG: T9SS type A sorting domain-containing protein [Saprospiraceae bacterium]
MKSIYTGMQFDESHGRTFEVKKNTISAKSIGINFSWTGYVGSTIVNDNNNINLLDQNAVGINIAETRGTTKFIIGNNINIGNGYKGINHENSSGSLMSNNSIYANGTSGLPNVGISITGGQNTMALCNLLSSNMNCHNQGLYVSESSNNADAGNQASGWEYDFQFLGTSLGTIFASNRMGNANHGLILGIAQGGLSARIGPQTHMRNRWNGTHVLGAYHYGPLPDRQKSLFTVNAQDPQNPDFKPNNFPENVQREFFANEQASSDDLISCNYVGSGIPNPFLRGFPRTDDYLIVNNNYPSDYDWGARIWTDKRQLYRQINNLDANSDLPNEFAQFYSNQSSTSVGKFEQVENKISDINNSDHSLLSAINSNNSYATDIESSIINTLNDMSQAADPSALASLRMQLSGLQNQLNSLTVQRLGLTTQFNQAQLSQIQAALSLNNSITTSEIYESNQKTANQYMLSRMISGDWSFNASDRAIILNIANQCPLYGGEGVYRARALASLWTDQRFQDNEICPQQLAQRSRTPNSIPTLDIEIYPNPADDYIIFAATNRDQLITSLEIANMDGKILQVEKIFAPGAELNVSVQSLQNGVYLAKLHLSDGSMIVKKFIKE